MYAVASGLSVDRALSTRIISKPDPGSMRFENPPACLSGTTARVQMIRLMRDDASEDPLRL